MNKPMDNKVFLSSRRGGEGVLSPQSRDYRIDSLKYCLIVLVIVGHVFNREAFSEVKGCVVIWKWIYMFHMPLFIFISGYFSRKKEKKDFKASILKLLEPLVVFQALALVLEYIHTGVISLIAIFTPWWALWYLLSLIFWRLILQLLPDKLLENAPLLIGMSFCISILAGFLPFDKVLSLQRTFAFLPFFFMGYSMKGKSIFLPDKYKPFSLAFLLIMFIIPLFFAKYLGGLTHGDPYGSFLGAVQRVVVFGISIPMSIAFINVCPKNEWLANQGRKTLQYYIYHAFMIPPLVLVITMLNLPATVLTALILVITIIIVIKALLRIAFINKLTNPSSLLKH